MEQKDVLGLKVAFQRRVDSKFFSMDKISEFFSALMFVNVPKTSRFCITPPKFCIISQKELKMEAVKGDCLYNFFPRRLIINRNAVEVDDYKVRTSHLKTLLGHIITYAKVWDSSSITRALRKNQRIINCIMGNKFSFSLIGRFRVISDKEGTIEDKPFLVIPGIESNDFQYILRWEDEIGKEIDKMRRNFLRTLRE